MHINSLEESLTDRGFASKLNRLEHAWLINCECPVDNISIIIKTHSTRFNSCRISHPKLEAGIKDIDLAIYCVFWRFKKVQENFGQLLYCPNRDFPFACYTQLCG